MAKDVKNSGKHKFNDLCAGLTGLPDFKNSIRLFHHHSQVSPFPHLVGFTGLPSYEVYAEKLALVSADHGYLLRIIHDNLNDVLEAHLLHAEEQKYQYAFLVLDEPRREFLTDAHGRVKLGKMEAESSAISVSVCPPSAGFRLSPEGTIDPVYVEENLRGSQIQAELFFSRPQATLKVKPLHLPPGTEIKRMVLVIGDEEEILIAVPQKGLAMFELPDSAGSLRIYLYE
ncbi:MAG: hypothetical protein NUW07_04730 [Candidatus Saccharicenans sp.]|jgi:hypothetical protein|nr:hypothetical protein [Candidatus Saccharicenans sp.]MDH7492700.1 hypothetical protein [Candidatus Saccharicenans sp.]